jgi:hypothetical protein
LLNVVVPNVALFGNWLVFRSLACSASLFVAVDRPAGAGVPSLVTAVAVVRFFATVVFTMSTNAASSSAMPPPSWAETLFAIVSLVMLMVCGLLRETCEPLVCSSRMPPPSSLARLAWMTLLSMVTGPEPSERLFGLLGYSPATMTAPPSS